MAVNLEHPTAEEVLHFAKSRKMSISNAIQIMYQSINSLRVKNSMDELTVSPTLESEAIELDV